MCMSLNGESEITLTPEQKCLNWYNQEPDPSSWLDELPSECPSKEKEAKRRGGYRRVSKRKTSVKCYEPKFPSSPSQASLRCCYSKRGGACISDLPNAGRAYRYHFKNNAREREENDLDPYDLCCIKSSTYCSLFYVKRPISRCARKKETPRPDPCKKRFRCKPPKRRRFWVFRRPRPGNHSLNFFRKKAITHKPSNHQLITNPHTNATTHNSQSHEPPTHQPPSNPPTTI